MGTCLLVMVTGCLEVDCFTTVWDFLTKSSNPPQPNSTLHSVFNITFFRQNCDKRQLVALCLPVCPSVRMEQLGSHRTDFHEIWCLSIFEKYVKRIQISFRCDKNKGYFTWRPIYIFYHISFSSSYNNKYFRQNTHFMFNDFFFLENRAVYEMKMKNIVQPDRP